MVKTANQKQLFLEFREFMNKGRSPTPSILYEKVRLEISACLTPSLVVVISKFIAIYTLSGIVVLAICPQFGFSLSAETGILGFFRLFGMYSCMALCGALFLGTGTTVASLVLLPEELRRIRSSTLLYFAGFGVIALAVFWAAGAEIAIGIGLVWLIGSILGESIAFESVCRLRFGNSW
ncbi:MAG: hypothetical protein R3B54_07180 [Bdellovibrionota bacterium]